MGFPAKRAHAKVILAKSHSRTLLICFETDLLFVVGALLNVSIRQEYLSCAPLKLLLEKQRHA
eukprot:5109752-Amphidinium_carterae.1